MHFDAKICISCNWPRILYCLLFFLQQGTTQTPSVVPEDMETSFASVDNIETTQSTYKPDTATSSSPSHSSSSDEARQTGWQEKKAVVSESKLLELFRFCQTCGHVIDSRQVSYIGSQMRVKWECTNDHKGVWNSCPSERGMPQSNLILAAAVLFTGSTYTRLEEWAKLVNLQIFSSRTFYDIQNTYLHPVIDDESEKQQRDILAKLFLKQQEGENPHLCSDGRSDSPGFNAKYTTYTFMTDPGKEIVRSELVQVRRIKQNSIHDKIILLICGCLSEHSRAPYKTVTIHKESSDMNPYIHLLNINCFVLFLSLCHLLGDRGPQLSGHGEPWSQAGNGLSTWHRLRHRGVDNWSFVECKENHAWGIFRGPTSIWYLAYRKEWV